VIGTAGQEQMAALHSGFRHLIVKDETRNLHKLMPQNALVISCHTNSSLKTDMWPGYLSRKQSGIMLKKHSKFGLNDAVIILQGESHATVTVDCMIWRIYMRGFCGPLL
jgi:hypothetical protein